MSHLGNFTVRTFQSFPAEEVSRTGTQLTTYNIFIQTVITVDTHMTDGSRFTFHNTHFQVNGVTVNIDFHRIQVIEYITTVVIVVTDSIFITVQTLIHQLLVIYISFFHTQLLAQQVRRINGVTHPRDVTDIILFTFMNLHVDIYRLFIISRHTVHHDLCVTITQLIIFVDNQLLIFLIFFLNEFLGTEQVDQFSLLIGLLHYPFQLLITQDAISLKRDLMNLYLCLFIDIYIHIHLLIVFRIFPFHDIHFGIFKTFFIKMFLDQSLRTVNGIRSNLKSFYHTDLCLQVFSFTLLDPVEYDISNTRTLGQLDMQVNLITDDLFRINTYRREQSVTPVALHRTGNVISRNRYGLSDSQS